MYSLLAIAALAGSALGQAITLSNTTFTAPVAVGATWPISYSAGDGSKVAIAFGNSTYAFQVVDGLTAPGVYSWKVAVPVNVVAGVYQLALIQGSNTTYSPAFSLVISADMVSSTTDAPTTSVSFPIGADATVTTTATTTVTAVYLPGPTPSLNGTTNATLPATVTYIYWEESCGCHQTSSVERAALPTTPMSTTTVTYSEKACGCTTTVTAPCAETVIPAPVVPTAQPAPPASNTPIAPVSSPAAVPAAATMAAPVAPQATVPATFTGGVDKTSVAGSSLGFLALLAAMVVA